jgi:hypothetical protein
MLLSNPHNLARPITDEPLPFGIRVSLKAGDPFRNLLGADWHRFHWFATALERDTALTDMGRKHEYSRPGDRPAIEFKKVEKLAQSRGL